MKKEAVSRDKNNGFGELTEWFIGKIKLTKHERNEKVGPNPFGRRRVCIIPLLHHSVVLPPIEDGMRQEHAMPQQISMISMSCRISETLILGYALFMGKIEKKEGLLCQYS